MHSRTPGPKQTIPARLKAGCDNQIENYVLVWGVRWTNPRSRPCRKENVMYPNPPNTSDVPHDRCPSSSKSLSPIPANTPTHDIPYVNPPTIAHGSRSVPSTNVNTLAGHQRSSSSSSNLPTIVDPTHTHASLSLPKLDLASADKRHPLRPYEGYDFRQAFPTSTNRCNVPVSPMQPSVASEGRSSSPTPFFPTRPIVSLALDSFVADDYAISPPSIVNDWEEHTNSDEGIIDPDDYMTPSFFAYQPEYQLSSHSELAAFASDGGFIPSRRRPTGPQ